MRQFPEKPFQASKIIFKSPKLIGQKLLSYGHLLKDKRLKFTFVERANLSGFVTWKFTTKKDLNPQKQVFFLNLGLWLAQKSKMWSFLWESSIVGNLAAFGSKITTLPCLIVVAIRVAYLVAFTTIA